VLCCLLLHCTVLTDRSTTAMSCAVSAVCFVLCAVRTVLHAMLGLMVLCCAAWCHVVCCAGALTSPSLSRKTSPSCTHHKDTNTAQGFGRWVHAARMLSGSCVSSHEPDTSHCLLADGSSKLKSG
jgi:hypothetical protein